MAKAASSDELKSAFGEHLEQTKGQVQRLEQVFELLGQKARSKPCKGMRGLIEEGQETIEETQEEHLHDLSLIAAAQKVEHYEISGYGTVRTFRPGYGQQGSRSIARRNVEGRGHSRQEADPNCQIPLQRSAPRAEILLKRWLSFQRPPVPLGGARRRYRATVPEAVCPGPPPCLNKVRQRNVSMYESYGMPYCCNCGNQVRDTDQFCGVCGQRQTPARCATPRRRRSPARPALRTHQP